MKKIKILFSTFKKCYFRYENFCLKKFVKFKNKKK